MKLNFIGATHEVTGSCTYIEACGKRFLVDFGMEQGVGAAVHEHHVAVDAVGQGGDQEDDHVGDVLRVHQLVGAIVDGDGQGGQGGLGVFAHGGRHGRGGG